MNSWSERSIRKSWWPAALALACGAACATGPQAASVPAQAAQPEATTPAANNDPAARALFDTVAALDTELFDSFNRCADPAQLKRHEALFAPDVEFYHDLGGVTWTREQMLANTRNNVCGKIRRELVPGSLRVYPIKGFGAMEIGEHRFCASGEGQCAGRGEFVMIWRRDGERWIVTRVLSYAHRGND